MLVRNHIRKSYFRPLRAYLEHLSVTIYSVTEHARRHAIRNISVFSRFVLTLCGSVLFQLRFLFRVLWFSNLKLTFSENLTLREFLSGVRPRPWRGGIFR